MIIYGVGKLTGLLIFSKVSKCPHRHREVFHVIDWKGLYTSITFDCPIITKLTVGRLLKCKYTRELTKIYNIMYNIYGIHLAFISFIYVTGMGSIAFSVEHIGDVLEKIEDTCKNTRLLNICFTIKAI